MSKEIREMIDKVKNFKQFVNENSKEFTNTDKLKQLYLNNGFSDKNVMDMAEEGYFNKIEWFDEDTLIVYRSITLLESEINEFKNDVKKNKGVGQYWSFDSEIRSIWGGNADFRNDNKENIFDILITGHLKLKNIDFNDLVYAFKDDYYNFISEKEIRGLKGGNSVKVISYKIHDL